MLFTWWRFAFRHSNSLIGTASVLDSPASKQGEEIKSVYKPPMDSSIASRAYHLAEEGLILHLSWCCKMDRQIVF